MGANYVFFPHLCVRVFACLGLELCHVKIADAHAVENGHHFGLFGISARSVQ